MPMAEAMRVARFQPKRTFEIAELATPEPGPGEVRVRVGACGICGTDLTLFHAGLMAPGHVPGHEIAGRVDRIGPGVEGLAEGDPVAVEPIRACGDCRECAAGRPNICRQVGLLGIHMPGGLAEAVVAPAERLFPVPDDLAPELAALTEPVAVAVHGLVRGNLEPGQRVLVLGSGAVGLVTALAARFLGAGDVWTTARYESQADAARRIGASRVLREDEASPEALATLANEVDFDLVVETVGHRADTLRAASAAIRPGGTVSVLGVFLGPAEVDPFTLLLKEGALVWSNCYERCAEHGADFATAVRLVDAERERLAPLITHRRALSETGDAFSVASDKLSGAVKVSVLPGLEAGG